MNYNTHVQDEICWMYTAVNVFSVYTYRIIVKFVTNFCKFVTDIGHTTSYSHHGNEFIFSMVLWFILTTFQGRIKLYKKEGFQSRIKGGPGISAFKCNSNCLIQSIKRGRGSNRQHQVPPETPTAFYKNIRSGNLLMI